MAYSAFLGRIAVRAVASTDEVDKIEHMLDALGRCGGIEHDTRLDALRANGL